MVIVEKNALSWVYNPNASKIVEQIPPNDVGVLIDPLAQRLHALIEGKEALEIVQSIPDYKNCTYLLNGSISQNYDFTPYGENVSLSPLARCDFKDGAVFCLYDKSIVAYHAAHSARETFVLGVDDIF